MLSLENGSGMISKLFVNRWLPCSSRENEPSFHSAHIVGECSSVALEQNLVQRHFSLFACSQPVLENAEHT